MPEDSEILQDEALSIVSNRDSNASFDTSEDDKTRKGVQQCHRMSVSITYTVAWCAHSASGKFALTRIYGLRLGVPEYETHHISVFCVTTFCT